MNRKEVSFGEDKQCLSNTGGTVKRTVVTRRSASKAASAPPPAVKDSIPTTAFLVHVESWLAECDQQRHSDTTISSRRERCGRLHWFLTEKKYGSVGMTELRAFFYYLNHAHEAPPYRWNNDTHKKCKEPMAPGRINAFHSSLRTFFNWLVAENFLNSSPMERIKPAVDRKDQIEPFTEDDCKALLAAAYRSSNPRRDRAIIALLLDTGIRASELADLTVDDVLLDKCRVIIQHGKGDKKRVVPFSADVRRYIHEYIQFERGQAEQEGESLFLSTWGKTAGEGLTSHGLGQLFDRLKIEANIQGVRCSPHTCRHTFAIMFLRAGGNVFSLQAILGHESLTMTQNYVKIAAADAEAQHRQFSPMDRLKRSRKVRK